MRVEDNDFTRISVPTKADWVSGQHCFLRFKGFGMHSLTSHPFTICSLPRSTADGSSEMTFYLRHRGGFTATLYKHALHSPEIPLRVSVDGPYGGLNSRQYFNSNRILVIAGGSGAGWTLPFVEQYIRQVSAIAKQKSCEEKDSIKSTDKTSKQRSLRVILATRDTATRVWYHKTVKDLLAKYKESNLKSNMEVEVFVTAEETDRPSHTASAFTDLEANTAAAQAHVDPHDAKSAVNVNSSSSSTAGELGRPRLPNIVAEEAGRSTGAGESLSVYVCGPLAMQNDVRNAVAAENLQLLKTSRDGGVYLHVEHFSWA